MADDSKVKAICTIMENEIENAPFSYSDEFKAELDRRFAAYESGASKLISAAESQKRIHKLMSVK